MWLSCKQADQMYWGVLFYTSLNSDSIHTVLIEYCYIHFYSQNCLQISANESFSSHKITKTMVKNDPVILSSYSRVQYKPVTQGYRACFTSSSDPFPFSLQSIRSGVHFSPHLTLIQAMSDWCGSEQDCWIHICQTNRANWPNETESRNKRLKHTWTVLWKH